MRPLLNVERFEEEPTEVKVFGIYGCGGYGKEIFGIVASLWPNELASGSIRIVFIDDAAERREQSLFGCAVSTPRAFMALDEPKSCVVAIGSAEARRDVVRGLTRAEIVIRPLIDPTALVRPFSTIGEAAVIGPYSIVESGATIGDHVHINMHSYVAHDCVIGDFVTISPRASCNGRVIVEEDAFIGSGAIIRPAALGSYLVIGRGAIVGMGAVVTKDVPPDMVVAGNPARVLRHKGEKSVDRR